MRGGFGRKLSPYDTAAYDEDMLTASNPFGHLAGVYNRAQRKHA